jgi:hypothetical protein
MRGFSTLTPVIPGVGESNSVAMTGMEPGMTVDPFELNQLTVRSSPRKRGSRAHLLAAVVALDSRFRGNERICTALGRIFIRSSPRKRGPRPILMAGTSPVMTPRHNCTASHYYTASHSSCPASCRASTSSHESHERMMGEAVRENDGGDLLVTQVTALSQICITGALKFHFSFLSK